MNDTNLPPEQKIKNNIKQSKHNQTDKEKQKMSNNISWAWPIKIAILTLVLSILISISSELLLSNAGLIISTLILIFLILVSVAFDMLGVAVTAASLEPFLAMAARKQKGAKEAISLVKNAEKISNISCDVVGDMCGIISGAVGASIVIKIILATNGNAIAIIISALVSSFIAAITVFGKAMGKRFAINSCNSIVLIASKIVRFFKFKKEK